MNILPRLSQTTIRKQHRQLFCSFFDRVQMNRDISVESVASPSASSVFSQGQLSTDESMSPPHSRKENSANKMLEGLLDDANKYYPTYQDSMPTSYLKSSKSVVSYNESDLADSWERSDGEEESPVTKSNAKKSDKPVSKRKSPAKANSKTTKRPKALVDPVEKKKATRKTPPTPGPDSGKHPKSAIEQQPQAHPSSAPESPVKTEDASIATSFAKWDGKKVALDYSFFDVPFLRNNTSYEGTPTSSMGLHCHSKPTSSSDVRKAAFERIIPTAKVRSVLFDNYQEEYKIDFEVECDVYNPMSEIGKIVEHTAMVYMPEEYASELKADIIPSLNKAFDTSNTDMFIATVNRYNEFIAKVPRTKIIDHLSTLRELPMSFVHDFLHIVYTRSIHPDASKLRRYKAFSNFVYGELLPGFLSDVYEQCGLGKDSIFMDLGSGVGNCVIQAGLEFGCRLSIGCEIMPDASTLTEVQMAELHQRCKLMGIQVPKFEFILRQSFVDNPRINELISKCDVMLINNFLFDSALNHEVEKILQHCKVGCKIISLKGLRSLAYTLDTNNLDNVLNKLHVEKHKFKENSVSWTHRSGEYYISTVRDVLDESLLSSSSRFRSQKRSFRYTR